MNAKKKPAPKQVLNKKNNFIQTLKAKRPVFQFFGIFAGVIILYYVFAWLCSGLFDSYIALTAKISATILSVLGTDATSSGSAIITPTFILSLSFGCEGTEPIVIYSAGILAFPARWKQKLIGLGIGIVTLYALNFIRIVSLYYIGSNDQQLFDAFHGGIFPAIFIFIAVIFFYLWLKWTSNIKKPSTTETL